MRPWATWTKLPCLCEVSSRGSIIVHAMCPEHVRLIPAAAYEDFVRNIVLHNRGRHFGPIRP